MNINLESLWSHNLQLAFDCLNAWPITCFVVVKVQKFSVSVQHLNLYLSKINLKRTPVGDMGYGVHHTPPLRITVGPQPINTAGKWRWTARPSGPEAAQARP